MARGNFTVYAHLCVACEHLLSRHSLVGDEVSGPYQCRDCACEVPQDTPAIPLLTPEYRKWASDHPDLTWEWEEAHPTEAASRRLAIAAERDPRLRARFQEMAVDTANRELVRDDFSHLEGLAQIAARASQRTS
jgi:hypothetical protein